MYRGADGPLAPIPVVVSSRLLGPVGTRPGTSATVSPEPARARRGYSGTHHPTAVIDFLERYFPFPAPWEREAAVPNALEIEPAKLS